VVYGYGSWNHYSGFIVVYINLDFIDFINFIFTFSPKMSKSIQDPFGSRIGTCASTPGSAKPSATVDLDISNGTLTCLHGRDISSLVVTGGHSRRC
jgi:hypothetical protein